MGSGAKKIIVLLVPFRDCRLDLGLTHWCLVTVEMVSSHGVTEVHGLGCGTCDTCMMSFRKRVWSCLETPGVSMDSVRLGRAVTGAPHSERWPTVDSLKGKC